MDPCLTESSDEAGSCMFEGPEKMYTESRVAARRSLHSICYTCRARQQQSHHTGTRHSLA